MTSRTSRRVLPLLLIAFAAGSACRSQHADRESAGGSIIERGLGAGDETGALSDIRAIISAEMAFSAACGNNGFAQQLEDLVKPMRGSTDGFLLSVLGTTGVVKNGYTFTLRPGDGATVVVPAADTCNGSERDAVSSFFVEAHPAGTVGRRSFAADDSGTIYARADGQPISPGMAGAEKLQ